MCEPLTLTALALGGAGAGLNAGAAAKSAKATTRAYEAESARQGALEKIATADVLNTANQFRPEDFANVVDRSEQRRMKNIRELPNAEPVRAEGTPQIIKTEQGRATREAADRSSQQNAALARMGAYGDRSLLQGIKLSDLGNRVGTNATLRNISQSALPLELQAASEKGRGMKMAGDIATLGSMLTGLYALTNVAGAVPAGTTIPQTGVPATGAPGLPYGGLPGGGPGGVIIV